MGTPTTTGSRRRRGILLLLTLMAATALVASLVPGVSVRWTALSSQSAQVRGLITEVGARIPGRVVSVETSVGARVERGDLLARLDDRHLVPRVSRARAAVARSDRELELERLTLSRQRTRVLNRIDRAQAEREAAEAQVESARARAEQAGREYQRLSEVLDTGAISALDLEKADRSRGALEALVESREASLRASEARWSEAQAELEGLAVLAARVRVAESEAEMARLTLEAARADLEATRIRAESDGVVIAPLAGPGASVRVGDPIVAVWSESEVWVEAQFDETELRRLRPGASVQVQLPAYPGVSLPGQIECLDLGEDPASEVGRSQAKLVSLLRSASRVTVHVRVEPDSRAPLLPGLTAEVVVGETPKGRAVLAGWMPWGG